MTAYGKKKTDKLCSKLMILCQEKINSYQK